MKITIAHLYYDLLNLYGENGNIKALKKQLENQGVSVTVLSLSIEDELHFDDYDMVYIGAGTEDNQKLVLKHLFKYRDEIEKHIKEKQLFLVTGNAIELFGRYIYTTDKKKIKALNQLCKKDIIEFLDEVDDQLMIKVLSKKNVIDYILEQGKEQRIKQWILNRR